jgi:hypothetical protein
MSCGSEELCATFYNPEKNYINTPHLNMVIVKENYSVAFSTQANYTC